MRPQKFSTPDAAFQSLRSAWCPECDVMQLCKKPWRPYTNDAAFGVCLDHRREIYIVKNVGPVGQGGNALVFATVVRAYWAEEDDGVQVYMPAALKVHRTPHEMTREAHAACCVNDVRRSGTSPNLSCLLDAFAIMRTHEHANGPPNEWYASFQHHINERYARQQGATTREHWGDQAVSRTSAGSMVLSPLVPIVVTLSEIVAPFRCENHTPANAKLAMEDDAGRHPPMVNLPPSCTHNRVHMGAVLFQAVHAIHGLHTFNMLHGDVQPGNMLVAASAEGVFLDPGGGSGGALEDDESGPRHAEASRVHTRATLGDTPSHDVRARRYAWCLDRSDSGDRFASVARLPNDAPALLCIDFGTTTECEVWRGADPERLRSSHFAEHLPSRVRRDCRYLVSRSPEMLYDDVGVDRHHLKCLNDSRVDLLPHQTPGMRLLERPVTQVYSRPPECIAVHIPDAPHNDRSYSKTGVAIYSDRSDVYSLGVVLASFVLGFEVFSGVISSDASEEAVRCGWDLGEHMFRAKPRSGSGRPEGDGVSMWSVQAGAVRAMYRHIEDMHRSRDDLASRCALRWLERNEVGYIARTWVMRCTAVGEPDASVLEGTVMQGCPRVGRPHHTPWLAPALLRRLTRGYGVGARDAQDLTDRIVAALHWDPAQRPTTRQLLRSAWFYTLFRCTEMPTHEVVTKEAWWAASLPHAASWSYTAPVSDTDSATRYKFDNPRAVTQKLRHLGKNIVKCSDNNMADEMRRRLYRKGACCPAVRLGRRRKHHYRRTPLHASRIPLRHQGTPHLSRWLARTVFRNVVYGAGIDPVHLSPVQVMRPQIDLAFVLDRRITPGVFSSKDSLRTYIRFLESPRVRETLPRWARVRTDRLPDSPLPPLAEHVHVDDDEQQ